MTTSIVNEMVLEQTTASQTEWVVAFPTKRAFVNLPDGRTLQSAVAPFQRPFMSGACWNVPASSCDEFALDTYDREGRKDAPQTGTGFPPPPNPNEQSNMLCGQANVLRFSFGLPSYSFGLPWSAVPLVDAQSGTTWATGWLNGFAAMRWTSQQTVAPFVTRVLMGSNHAYHGLPTVGFALQTFRRDGPIVNGVPSTSGYGGNFVHKPQRRIVPR